MSSAVGVVRPFLDEYVARLDVAVHQALQVCGMESEACLADELDAGFERERRRQLRQGPPFHQLEEDAGSAPERAHLVHLHHVGMIHPRLEPGLEEKSLGVARVLAPDEFHGHCPLEAPVPGSVHLPHPAAAKEALQLDATVEGGELLAQTAFPRAVRILRATSTSSGSG